MAGERGPAGAFADGFSWLTASSALFAQIVVAAVHCPAPVVFASPAITLASVGALFGDQAGTRAVPRDRARR